MLTVALITGLLAGLVGGALGFVAASRTVGNSVSLGGSADDTPALADRKPESVAGIAQKVQPSVVTINIDSNQASGNGSGFIISKDGYILTNNHVAAPGQQGAKLTVVFNDGTVVDNVKVVGTDPGSDVAVLKIEKSDLPAITFADSDKVAVGDPVVALGSPLGLNGTVTSGIVSALDRPVETGGEDGDEPAYMAAIQTDAAINPGNSGGPLVNGNGDVVGINSAIAAVPGGKSGNIGLGFAIPINQAKRMAEEIIATGKARRTVIGASFNRGTQLSTGGVKIVDLPDGPAKDAGLKVGDVIVRFNNRMVTEYVDLVALVRKLAPETKVPVEYVRDGKRANTTITLGFSNN